MRHMVRNIALLGWMLLLEAWRRREVYVLVGVTVAFILSLRFLHFFDMPDLSKFYREISLKIMNITTAFLVILLAARQLPREFQNRTIYPLLAKPVSRLEFFIGKYLGVLAAGVFCYGLFMGFFLVGSLTLSRPVHAGLFAEAVYLQVLSIALVAALTFLLSMVLNMDAAIAVAGILYLASQILMNLLSYLYDYVGSFGKLALTAVHYMVPQLTLFDASGRVVHSISGSQIIWGWLPFWVMASLTLYAMFYIAVYGFATYLLFRRKPL